MKKEKFESAVSFLTPGLFSLLRAIDDELKNRVLEVRLRIGKPIVLIFPDSTMFLDKAGRTTYIYTEDLYKVSQEEIKDSFNRLCNYSVYSHSDSIIQCFITLDSGHRVGIAGTAVTDNGRITSVRDVNSLNIRIAREFKGCADEIMKNVFKNHISNIIIAGPPSSGKTTLLRDIARQVSTGRFGEYHKVVIVDERCEISPVNHGLCGFDTGPNTDVLTSFRKSEGIMCALRTLSPEMIICDEIGTVDECEAIKSGLNSGVNFALSIHAYGKDELENKPQFKSLVKSGIKGNVVLLGSEICKIKEIIRIGDGYVQNNSTLSDCNSFCVDRAVC